MNTQDRAVVKALLQYMTDKCLTGSPEFRAAVKQFAVTTTWYGKDIEHDESAKILGVKHNHFVDVYYPSRIDAHPHGERFKFETKAEADAFAAHERANGDSAIAQLLAKASDLAPANPELVEALNASPAVDMAAAARAIIARAIHVGANSFGHVIGEHEELVEELRNAGYLDAARLVDEELDTIADEAMGDGTATHKVIRSRWLDAMRRVSAAI